MSPTKKENTKEKKLPSSANKSYIIKVTFPNKSYRHIRFSEKNTLEDLHLMIMATTDFFDEHLHSFFMDGVAWNENSEIRCRYDEEVPIKESDAYFTFKMLNLPVGYKFLYIFDYGDEWRFRCRVMKILDEDTDFPTVILSKGEPPIQYPDYEDED
ncbi:MAG TPA: hypothetical protein O0X27_02615 [Methanocorpusculum sp.]|nr:hypothetical protein [Methanocorpusculum sp.]